jgi:hypothetical protein
MEGREMTVTISKRGWIIETTNTIHGMLEQGGVSGRRELVTNEQLAKLGIVGAPGDMYNDGVDNEDKVRHEIRMGMPTRTIRTGHIIY